MNVQDLIEMAYYRENDDLANQITMLDEELAGIRPKSAPGYELVERLVYWLQIAAKRWCK